jgi:transmembrane sensor
VEDLIVHVLAGEASESDRQRLDAWRRALPEHERTYQEFVETWRLAALHESHGPIAPPPAVDAVVCKANSRRRQAIPLKTQQRHHSRTWRWIAAAAAAVVVIGTGIPLFVNEAPVATYQTGQAETLTASLADGSVVRLGPDSHMDVWGDRQRRVTINGTAFFAIAADSSRPFLVHSNAAEAEVLGTRFEIRAEADYLRLVVVEGRVALSNAGHRVEVSQGATSHIIDQSRPSPPKPADVWNMLDWHGGLLIFHATSLAQVVSEVEAHFGVPFVIRDSILAQRAVTAWFDDEPFEEVTSTICQVVGARCVLGDTVEVRP